MNYQANPERYQGMTYRRCGESGLRLPAISLGLWHNFGSVDDYENMKNMCFTAFDGGITHFDLANNYGPVPGSAEENFGRILREELSRYRDELLISTKAGYGMWPGPYGDGGSRKYLLSSLDQSLRRMGIPYVDIFYHHRMDPKTSLEESMMALDQAVKSGKALYAGLSNYDGPTLRRACAILRELKCPFVLNQNAVNVGSNQTFAELVRDSAGDYVAFCDQDDVWLEDKIANTVRLLEQSPLAPTMALANVSVMDGEGREIAPRMEEHRKRHVFLRGEGLAPTLIYRNFVMGCTVVMTRERAVSYLPFPA
ncbi:MAG: aldo/keto reductase, partial [Clostridia bacterium]|nr:aldo/keto reductase [Clostridia bacterium]